MEDLTNFGTNLPEPHHMTANTSQQQQQVGRELRFTTVGNSTLQNLGVGGGNMMLNSNVFQGRQAIQGANSTIPPYSQNIGNSIGGFQSQNNVNGGVDLFQQQGLTRLQPNLGQINSSRQPITSIQQQKQQQQQQQQQQQIGFNLTQNRPKAQLRSSQNPSNPPKKEQQSSLSGQTYHHHPASHSQTLQNPSHRKRPYEPAPDLTLIQKQYLETFIERDTLYQKALDIQHKRQMALITEKRKEMEMAQMERKNQSRNGVSIFGSGYDGYGNGITGNKFRIIYPHEKKRVKKTKEFVFSAKQLIEVAGKEDLLVPIRLEVDLDGYKLRDTFTWNMNETAIIPEHFAEVLCDDMHFPSASFVPAIAKQIRDQVQGYYLHPAVTAISVPPLNHSEESPKPFTSKPNPKTKLENANDDSLETKEMMEVDEKVENIGDDGELRILIKIDVTVGNISLVDQFEWDINCQKNDPELFAEILTTELGLGGEFKTAIAHSIREQVQIYVKSLILVGHPFNGSLVQDDDLRQNFLPILSTVLRKEEQVDQHTPLLVELTEAEIDKIEKDRDRDARRKRRQTRGRRGVILPDREPPKTHRTLLHNTSIIPDPTDENSFITVIASGMPPVQRKASSMGYDNYSAISEKPATLSQGKVRRGRTVAAGSSNLRGSGNQTQVSGFLEASETHSTGRSGSVGPTTPARESKESGKRSYRRTAGISGKELEEWTCYNCGCHSSKTPLLRKGPAGEKTLCNACGLYFQKNNTLRPMSTFGEPSLNSEGSPNTSPLLADLKSRKLPSSPSIEHPRMEVSATVQKLESKSKQNKNKIEQNGMAQTGSVEEISKMASSAPTPMTQGIPSKSSSKTPRRKTPAHIVTLSAPNPGTHTTSPTFSFAVKTSDSSTANISSNSRLITTPSPSHSNANLAVTKSTSLSKVVFPDWIVVQRDQLARKYPRDRFDITQRSNKSNEFRIKCFDCPGRLYQPGPDLTLTNFEIHLKNRIHRNNVEKRVNPSLATNSYEISGGNVEGNFNNHKTTLGVPGGGVSINEGTGQLTTSTTTKIKLSKSSKQHSTKSQSCFPSQSERTQSNLITTNNSQSSLGQRDLIEKVSTEKEDNVKSDESGYAVAVQVFIDNRNGIPETPINTSPTKPTKDQS
ncbi:hypothetical protein G9A89_014573 [Geosiphon pyriformis]|nr:hypothetical protein G9A89_014573 [Geosiphon pyriformis]